MALRVSISLPTNTAGRDLASFRRAVPGALAKVIRSAIGAIESAAGPKIPRRSGELARSFVKRVTATSGVYGSDDFRARFFEFGTEHMEAAPIVHPAFLRHTRRLEARFLEELRRAAR